MKRAIILLFAILTLSSCSQEAGTAENSETVTLSETTSLAETTAAAVQETTASVTESTAETAKESKPDEPEEILTIAEDGASVLNLRALIGADFRRSYYFGGNTVCIPVINNDRTDIYLVDIARREITGMTAVEFENYYIPNVYRISDEHFYMDLESGDYKHIIIKVNSDCTYEVTDYERLWEIPDICGEHILISGDGNITDSESGEILLATDARGLGDKSATWYNFVCPLDENRFVYYKDGYEWSNGVGVYDFSTHTATDIPDTEGKYFIMEADGKIYTEDSDYDYTGTTIYVSDINTSETHLLADISESGYVNYYFSPDDGEYIGAVLNNGKIILIDRENGDILREIALNEAYNIDGVSYYNYDVFFTDSFICAEYGGKIYMYPRDYSVSALDMNSFADKGDIFIDESGIEYCGKDIVCAAYYRGWDGIDSKYYVLIIDIANQEVIGKIERESCDGYFLIKRKDGVYAALHNSNEPSMIYKINSDGSYELTGYESISDIPAIPDICGSHTIIRDDSRSLVDKESGEVLVKSLIHVYDENGNPEIFGSKSDRYHHFVTAIDENRFIYETSNTNYITGMGIYDFETKTTTDFFIWTVLKISGNKIISYENEVDGDGISLYSTDISDMDSIKMTELLNRESFEGISERPEVYYYVPDDMEYIGARVYDYNLYDYSKRMYHYLLIDPDSGEFIHKLPDIFAKYGTFFTDSFICNDKGNFLYMISREDLR